MKMKLGVSACVIGDKVRFDSGHKLNRFLYDEVGQFAEFVPICPEVAIGLPIPRPAIRLMEVSKQNIRLVDTKNSHNDHTEKMLQFSEQKSQQLAKQQLCGYVVCAKSPTCGMERVKLYNPKGNPNKEGTTGLYTAKLLQNLPWLPIEEDGRLHDPLIKENFITRIFALHDLYQSVENGITRHAMIAFHSKYKLVVMAHSTKHYRSLGQLVAKIADHEEQAFFIRYRLEFMQALSQMVSKRGHTNVLMHLQGYFKTKLNKPQKAELSQLILAYREGLMPLLAPLTLINHYLLEYPDNYLSQQKYLHPYPEELKLRYGI